MKLKNTALLLILMVFVFLSLATFSYISKKFNYPPRLLLNTLIHAKKQSETLPDTINILLLGLDKRDDWLEKNQDTDTIIFININTKTLQAKLIPLPRDLWFQDTQTRINKIYQLSQSQTDPTFWIKKSFKTIIGQDIDNIIILDTQVLAPIVEMIGPVKINLDYDLIDDQYPNPAYITDPKNNPDPYMTITFLKGTNIIDSDNVSYFVRSRKGSNLVDNGGTDLGRSQRQQLLIEGILNKIKQEKIYLNLNTTGSLYNIWSRLITKDIDDQTILAIFFKNKLNFSNLKISSISLPIGLTKNDDQSVLYHPLSFKNNAWVYLPTGGDYSSIHLFVDQQLN